MRRSILVGGLFAPNGGPQVAAVLLSARGGVLSTRMMRLVRSEQFGGPGFVPFLFPGFRFASEATDVGRRMHASGNPLRAGQTDTTFGGEADATFGSKALTCDVLV
jgi:hypothetical protein